MDSNYWFRRGRFGRRTLLARTTAIVSGGAALALVGCGDDDESGPPSGLPSAAPSVATEKGVEGSVIVRYLSPKTTYTNLDFGRHLDAAGHTQLASLDTLLRLTDPDTVDLEPGIIQSLPEQPDKQTYVFNIRTDAKWHNRAPVNGRSFTAEDVRFHMQRQIDGTDTLGAKVTPAFARAGVYGLVEKVEVTDSSHLTVRLRTPNPQFLVLLALEGGLQPREVLELIDRDPTKQDPAYLLGTGPYICEEYSQRVGARDVFVRNPESWERKVNPQVALVDKIFIEHLSPDENTLQTAFLQKQIDTYNSLDPTVFQQVMNQAKGATATQVAQGALVNLFVNRKSAPFDNPQLNRALDLAIDRSFCIQQVFQGQGRPSAHVPWSFSDWALQPDELATQPGYRQDKTEDLKEARAMWAAAGGPGIGDVVLGTPDATANAAAWVEWFPAMLNRNLGVTQFKAETYPVAQLIPRLSSTNWRADYFGGSNWVSPDPRDQTRLAYGTGGPRNFAGYSSPEVDALLASINSEFDLAKAQSLSKELQRKLVKESGGGIDPIAVGLRNYATWPYLHRPAPSKFGQSGVGFDGWILPFGVKRGGAHIPTWVDQSDPTFASRPKRD